MNIKTIGAAVLAGAMIAGCGKNEEPKQEDVMAVSVNGVKLMQSAIDADVEKIVDAQKGKIPAEQLEYAKQSFANQVVQGFIVENALVAKAKGPERVMIITDAMCAAGEPDAEIYVFSLTPITQKRSDAEELFTRARIEAFNEAIAQMAENGGWHYMDLYTAMADEDGWLPEADASQDGIHFNGPKYAQWVDFLKTYPYGSYPAG